MMKMMVFAHLFSVPPRTAAMHHQPPFMQLPVLLFGDSDDDG